MSGDEEARARAVLAEMQLRISQGPHSALGVSNAVSPEEIRAAFLALTKQFHPARFGRMSPDLQKLSNEVFLGIKLAHDQLLKGMGSALRPRTGAPQSDADPLRTPTARGTASLPRSIAGTTPPVNQAFARGTDRSTNASTTTSSGADRSGGVPVGGSSRASSPVIAQPRTVTPVTPTPSRTATPVNTPRQTGAIPVVRPTTGSMPAIDGTPTSPSQPSGSRTATPSPFGQSRPGTPPPAGQSGPASGHSGSPYGQRPGTPPPGQGYGQRASTPPPAGQTPGQRPSTPPPTGPVARPGTPPSTGPVTAQRPATPSPTGQVPTVRATTPTGDQATRPNASAPTGQVPIHQRATSTGQLPPNTGMNQHRTTGPMPAQRPNTPPTSPPATVAAGGVLDEAAALREATALMDARNWTAARQALHALAARVPQSKQYRALLCYARGREAHSAGRGEDALLEYQRALQLDPDLSSVKIAVAELQRRR